MPFGYRSSNATMASIDHPSCLSTSTTFQNPCERSALLPTPVTAMMSAAVKAAAFAAMVRVFLVLGRGIPGDALLTGFSTLAFLTMIVGNLLALPQRNVKRMLAYSSISHAGYLLVGVASLFVRSGTTKGGVLHATAPASALSRIVAVRIHLDDSEADNGPLRVLPGTHTMGILSDERIQALASSITPVDCVVKAGSVVVMRPLIVHASPKSHSDRPRRVLHVEYAASRHIADGVELAVDD